eukprot:gene9673-1885_t
MVEGAACAFPIAAPAPAPGAGAGAGRGRGGGGYGNAHLKCCGCMLVVYSLLSHPPPRPQG